MPLLEWNMYYLKNVFDVARHLIYLGILANRKKKNHYIEFFRGFKQGLEKKVCF